MIKRITPTIISAGVRTGSGKKFVMTQCAIHAIAKKTMIQSRIINAPSIFIEPPCFMGGKDTGSGSSSPHSPDHDGPHGLGSIILRAVP
jgi:hypothetical protein